MLPDCSSARSHGFLLAGADEQSYCGRFVAAYKCRNILNNRQWLSWATVGFIAATCFLFAGSRDTNNYFLPFLIPFYFLVFKRWRIRLTLIAAIAIVFFAHMGGLEKSPRWKCPLANVVTQRIIPDKRLWRLFQEKYHLPDDKIVMPCSGLWIYDDHPNLIYIHSRFEKRDDWVTVYGMDLYRKFLFTNPRYVLEKWLNSWDMYNTPSWSYSDERIREKMLSRNSYSFLKEIPAAACIVILIFGLMLFRRNPLILFCLLHARIIRIIAYHGDAMEVPRHCQQAAMTLRISPLLFLVQSFSAVKHAALSGEPPAPAHPLLV